MDTAGKQEGTLGPLGLSGEWPEPSAVGRVGDHADPLARRAVAHDRLGDMLRGNHNAIGEGEVAEPSRMQPFQLLEVQSPTA